MTATMQPHEISALFIEPGSAIHAIHILNNKNTLKTLTKMLANPDMYPTLEWNIVQQTPLSIVDFVYFNILMKHGIQTFRITDAQMATLRKDQVAYLERLYNSVPI